MIYNYNEFLNEGSSYSVDDVVIIYYQFPGSDEIEPCSVRITQKNPKNSYQVEFLAPYENYDPITVSGNKILYRSEEIKEPLRPQWTQEQPTGTDYHGAAAPNQITNDFVLPNS